MRWQGSGAETVGRFLYAAGYDSGVLSSGGFGGMASSSQDVTLLLRAWSQIRFLCKRGG